MTIDATTQGPGSTQWCIAVAVGPVQDFIGAARRLSDLQAGSAWLQWMARTVATLLVRSHGASLFLPQPVAGGLPPKTGLTNVVLAGLPGSKQPATVLADLREQLLKAVARHAAACARGLGPGIDTRAMEEQVCGAVRLHGAWVAVAGEVTPADLRRVERLLAARKRTRPFEPNRSGALERPKSSLDGLRESVVLVRGGTLSRRLRLGEREHLDGLGVLRRRLGIAGRLPSLTRVAAEPWVRLVAQAAKDDVQLRTAWSDLLEACEALVRAGFATRCRGVFPFPYDGELLFAERAQLAASSVPAASGLTMFAEQLQRLRTRLKHLQLPEAPVPYVAMIHADGDELGPYLARCGTMALRTAAGQALTAFVQQLPGRLAPLGAHVLYAGGEDALVVVPVDEALAAARSIRESFIQQFSGFEQKPTISVGVAVRHVMQPVRALRTAAKGALGLAKNASALRGSRRNALVLDLAPRAGAPVQARGEWVGLPAAPAPLLPEHAGGFDQHLACMAEMFRSGELPADLPYQWRRLNETAGGLQDLFELQVLRLMDRRCTMLECADWLARLSRPVFHGQLQSERNRQVQSQLLIGRWLAGHTPQGRA